MLKNVSMFPGISRSVNKPGDKAKSGGKSQSLEPRGFNRYGSSGSAIFCLAIYVDCSSAPENLAVSSVSIFFNFSISFRLRAIVREIFSNYNFFCFQRRAIFLLRELYSFSARANSDSTLEYWIAIL